MVDTSTADDTKMYRIKINRAIPVGPFGEVMTPLTDNVVKGSALKAYPSDAIVSFEEATTS